MALAKWKHALGVHEGLKGNGGDTLSNTPYHK